MVAFGVLAWAKNQSSVLWVFLAGGLGGFLLLESLVWMKDQAKGQGAMLLCVGTVSAAVGVADRPGILRSG